MQRLTFLFTLFLLLQVVPAQATEPYHHHSLGFNVSQAQSDPGLGLVWTSPYFMHERVAVRLAYSEHLFRGIPLGQSTQVATSYGLLRFGLVGVSSEVYRGIRLYGEGGGLWVLTSPQLSASNFSGAFGYFGFEFFIPDDANQLTTSYTIELCVVGSGAHAELMQGNPNFLPGFSITVGWKHYF